MDPKSVLLGLREKSVGLSKAQTRIPWREIITEVFFDFQRRFVRFPRQNFEDSGTAEAALAASQAAIKYGED